MECIFKPAKNWTYGFQTSCEAYIYYYPYNKAIPTKCVSQPDDDAVKYALNSYWTTLNTSTTISDVAKTLNDENNLIWQNSSSQESCSSSDLKCKVYDIISFHNALHTVNTLMDLYGGQYSLLHGRCSYSQRYDNINLDPGFISSDHLIDHIFDQITRNHDEKMEEDLNPLLFSIQPIFDRQECEGVI